jgi:hypothetical protein
VRKKDKNKDVLCEKRRGEAREAFLGEMRYVVVVFEEMPKRRK